MTPELSNSLSDLAERIREANEAVVVAERTTIEKALEAGRLLCEAKDGCEHGQWLPFLGRAETSERQAQRLMQLARSGLKSDTCRELGGIKASLEYLAKRKMPAEGEAVLISTDGWQNNPEQPPLAIITPSAPYPGYYDVSVINLRVDSFVDSLEKPVLGATVRLDDGSFFCGLWEVLDEMLSVPALERSFTVVPAALLEDDFPDLDSLPDPHSQRLEDAPLPKSLVDAKAALKRCIRNFSPEAYFEACEIVRVACVKSEQWPNDPKLMNSYIRIAKDDELMWLVRKASELALANGGAS